MVGKFPVTIQKRSFVDPLIATAEKSCTKGAVFMFVALLVTDVLLNTADGPHSFSSNLQLQVQY